MIDAWSIVRISGNRGLIPSYAIVLGVMRWNKWDEEEIMLSWMRNLERRVKRSRALAMSAIKNLFDSLSDRRWFKVLKSSFLVHRSAKSSPEINQSTAEVDKTPLPRADSPLLEDNCQIYAVGDIHGRADLLEKLLFKIETDAADFEGEKHVVFLGDYIDRGLQSRQVIEILLSDRLSAFETHFIKGNHEDALLSFLSDPSFGPKWAAYGGRETLVSYGVRPPRSLSHNQEWEQAHDAFLSSFPNAHQKFFMTLPTRVQIGGYGFVHAGLRPGKNFAEQDDYDLMWIRDEFLDSRSTFDVVVVHGHTPVDEPYSDHRRINVDTGAYFTGRLSAAKLSASAVEFISTDT